MDEEMASELAEQEGRAAEMRRSIDAINAVRAGRVGNPAMVDAAAMAEAALKMGAGPRSADFARVSDIQSDAACPARQAIFMPCLLVQQRQQMGNSVKSSMAPCLHRCYANPDVLLM